jgi:glycosyltransferase involved in cell wall biosynthesis
VDTPRKLRILQITHQGDIGGSTNSISYLTDGLARRGHQVFLCCRPESLLHARFSGHRRVRLAPFSFGRSPLAIGKSRGIARIASRHQIDIVNAHASLDRHLTIQARHLFRGSFRLVHTRRNVPLSSGGRLQGKYYGAFTDKIIAVSHRVAEGMVAGGVPAERIAVVHNGIPLAQYADIPEEKVSAAQRSLAISKDLPVVGVVARKKSHAELLRAMAEVPGEAAVLFLGIDRDEELERLRASLGLAHPVVYGGFREDVLPYYRLLSVFVLPSLIEGFSLSILEAMALGLPVVCTDAGGNAEAVREGSNGFLYDPGDTSTLAAKISLLLADEGLRRTMGERNRREAFERFDVEKTIAKTEEVYLSLLAGR